MQSAAIPEVLAGGDVLLASHTGSGKTLAYLLPLVRVVLSCCNSHTVATFVGRRKRPCAASPRSVPCLCPLRVAPVRVTIGDDLVLYSLARVVT